MCQESNDEDDEEGDVSELLDEALSDCSDVSPAPPPLPVKTQQVQMRVKDAPTSFPAAAARALRPKTMPAHDSDVESLSGGGGDYFNTRGNRNSAPSSSDHEDRPLAHSIDAYRQSK